MSCKSFLTMNKKNLATKSHVVTWACNNKVIVGYTWTLLQKLHISFVKSRSLYLKAKFALKKAESYLLKHFGSSPICQQRPGDPRADECVVQPLKSLQPFVGNRQTHSRPKYVELNIHNWYTWRKMFQNKACELKIACGRSFQP